jgi:hypothetical protein
MEIIHTAKAAALDPDVKSTVWGAQRFSTPSLNVPSGHKAHADVNSCSL